MQQNGRSWIKLSQLFHLQNLSSNSVYSLQSLYNLLFFFKKNPITAIFFFIVITFLLDILLML